MNKSGAVSSISAPDIERLIADGLAQLQAGDAPAAGRLFQSILDDAPEHAETLYLSGLALHQQGASAKAIARITRALPELGNAPEARFNLALIQSAAGLYTDAAETLSALVDEGHRDAQIQNALGVALKNTGRFQDAEAVLLEVIQRAPDFAGAHFNLGNVLLAAGRPSEAITAFESAATHAPGDTAIRLNLATALQSLGETARAEDMLTALAQSAPNADILNNLALLQRQRGDRQAARKALENALRLAPDHADAAYNLGTVLADLNDIPAARDHYRRAATARPGFLKAAWAEALALPQIYPSEDARQAARKDWLKGLEQITAQPLSDTDLPAAFAAVSEITPFALAYQGGDDKDAMTVWGNMVSDIASRALPDLAEPPRNAGRVRKRIGFVSAHFRAHTIERLFAGWLESLDPEMFEVFLISTSGPGDARTQDLAAKADGHITTAMGLHELARAIHGLACDVLIYPDIGMDPRTQVLAALPLAPKQATSWGHPVTCGFPTVQAFLSSEGMEPEDGDAHYREDLIRLPGLSIAPSHVTAPGGETPTHDFLCAQSLFKIAPVQDAAFAAIAAETGGAVSFIAHPIPEVTNAFRTRIAAVFRGMGINPDESLRFVPPCPRDDFLRHLKGGRVILDTFEWSGGNTSLEAFAMGIPTLTLPGRFMRGRHTLAMLEMMDLGDLVAQNGDDYIQRACRLFHDQAWHGEMSEMIARKSDRLFDGADAVQALNRFLRDF